MHLKKIFVLFILVLLSLLSACTSISDNPGDAVVEDRTGTNANGQITESYNGQTGAYNDSAMGQGMEMSDSSMVIEEVDLTMMSDATLTDAQIPLLVQRVYFDYDSITINIKGQSALNAHAEFLSLNPNKILIVEGHTDEQGTREYNLALGERRSWSVVDFLIASGISKEQLEIRSYGEENPISLDKNETAWQLNRRVELLY